MTEQSEVIDFLTTFAKSMKKKGYDIKSQQMGMKFIFDGILADVYNE